MKLTALTLAALAALSACAELTTADAIRIVCPSGKMLAAEYEDLTEVPSQAILEILCAGTEP